MSETNNSYKIYASKNYVDERALPQDAGEYKQLVTDGSGEWKVEERLAYVNGVVETDLIPEQTIEFTAMSETLTNALSSTYVELVDGQAYTVLFDGVEYNLVCKYHEEQGMPYLGNGSAAGLEETDEPFMLASLSGQTVWFAYNAETMHTVQLKGMVENIVTIPRKYIDWAPTLIKISPREWTAAEKDYYYEAFKKGSMLVFDDNSIVIGMFYSETVGLHMSWLSSAGDLTVHLNGEETSISLNKSSLEYFCQSVFDEQRLFRLYQSSAIASEREVGDLISAILKWDETKQQPTLYTTTDAGNNAVNLGYKYFPMIDAPVTSSDNGKVLGVVEGSVGLVTLDIPSTEGLASETYVTEQIAAIPAELPTVTADNNGQFLRVVDGAWAAVAVPSAEEASF